MIDRHRSLIHTLMAGLVGLTLGLFIAWWVWPVQWIEAPNTAPGAAPAASAPAQSAESPAAENTNADSNYSAMLDWVSQGLLYVAAALLLVGGVVIGYQLLRQSQGKDPTGQPFPLPFSRNRSNQATAPRGLRVKSPPLAGRPARQRQPSLNWLKREGESGRPVDAEEPVFEEQSFSAPGPSELSSHVPSDDDETSQQEILGTEAGFPTSQQSDNVSPEDWTDQESGGSIGQPERPAGGVGGPDGPVSYGVPETAVPTVEGGGDVQDGEPFIDRSEESLSQLESTADEMADNMGDVRQTGTAPVASETELIGENRVGETQELGEDDWKLSLPEAPSPEAFVDPEEEAGESTETVTHREASVSPEEPADREERGAESFTIPRPDAESVDTVGTQVESFPGADSSRQLVGQFDANYAFGIQTYDESFTINTSDGELLGACGMGINESVDRAAANLDQVRLLDIWLYDREAVRSVSQPLVSPGFDVSGLEDYGDGSGSESSSPLEVTPGLTCTLRSDHIVIECTIKSATFLDSEQAPLPFRSVSASLTVYVQS